MMRYLTVTPHHIVTCDVSHVTTSSLSLRDDDSIDESTVFQSGLLLQCCRAYLLLPTEATHKPHPDMARGRDLHRWGPHTL
jgi:hypothetical protein